MESKETIAVAGNIEVPCYLVIKQLGYSIEMQIKEEKEELWIAEKLDIRFIASNPVELLGMIYMREIRGSSWKANDEEIEAYLSKYYEN